MKKDKNILIGLFVFILIYYSSAILFAKCQRESIIVQENEYNLQDTIIISDSVEFSEKELKKYIKHLNLKHPDIVYAQAVLETGNFTSSIFTNNNNVFGMKQAQARNNTARGSANGHAYYSNWKQSVIDYALFQSSYMRKLSREEYFRYLDRNYARDPNYSRKLKEIIKRYEFN